MKFDKIAYFSIGSFAGAILGFITLPILTWFFTTDDIGRFSMYQLSLNLGMILISLDMHQAYVREYYETPKKEQLLKIALLPGSIVFALFFLIFNIFNLSLSWIIFNVDDDVMNICVFFAIYITFFINILVHVLRMKNFAVAFAFYQVIPKLGYLMSLGILVYLFENLNYKFLVLTNFFVLVISLLSLIFFLKKDLYDSFKIKLDKIKLKEMLLFSSPLVMGSLAYWALTSVDRIFLKNYSNYKELALYSVASTLAGGVSVLVTVFSNLWHPTVYKWIKEGIEIKKVLAINELMVIFICILWTLIGVFSWVFIYLFPATYNGIQFIIIGCVAMPLIYMLSETTTIGIGLTRKTSYAMLASCLALVLNIILNYLLVKGYGARGAALASMSAFTLFLILRTEFSSYLWVSLSRWKMYVSILLYYVLTLIIVLGKYSNLLFEILSWISILIVVCVLYYQRLVWLLKNFNPRVLKC